MPAMHAEPSSASESAPAVRRASWIALGFGAWLVAAFFRVLWAIAQGQSPDVAASPFHIPLYTGLVALAAFSGITVVRAIPRGERLRGALARAPATMRGAR